MRFTLALFLLCWLTLDLLNYAAKNTHMDDAPSCPAQETDSGQLHERRDVSDLPAASGPAQADAAQAVPEGTQGLRGTRQELDIRHWLDLTGGEPDVALRILRDGEHVTGIEIDPRYRDLVTYTSF